MVTRLNTGTDGFGRYFVILIFQLISPVSAFAEYKFPDQSGK